MTATGTNHFVGWKGRAFYFHAPTGYKMKLTGPRSGIVRDLKGLLPVWYSLAVHRGHNELAADIKREAGSLEISVFEVIPGEESP